MSFDLAQGLDVLERTPAAVRALLAGLGDGWTRCDEGERTFSPYDVVGHLIEGERTDWMPRVRTILEHGDSKSFAPFDRFAMWEWSKGTSLEALLDTFAKERAESLRELRALRLSPADLARRGRHPALGAVTLGELLATWVVHDLNHLHQIARTMARRWTDAVGPWKAYLGILNLPRSKPTS